MKEIEQLIEKFDKDKILSQLTKNNMNISLTGFIEEAILKFIDGQIEHGGNLENRDLDEEIFYETIDLFWYNAAKKW